MNRNINVLFSSIPILFIPSFQVIWLFPGVYVSRSLKITISQPGIVLYPIPAIRIDLDFYCKTVFIVVVV